MSTTAGSSWVTVPPGSLYPVANLPYCAFGTPGAGATRIGVRIGDQLLDLYAAEEAGLVDAGGALREPRLDALLALGRPAWQELRGRLIDLLTDGRHEPAVRPLLRPLATVGLALPFTVADFVDFYSCREHAENLGRMFRPKAEPLLPNWRHLPVGYHGRSGTVVVSGTPITRPVGQLPPRTGGSVDAAPETAPEFAPTRRLDLEAEVGFVVGVPTEAGARVGTGDLADHVFGVVLVNDWSARDIQSWEYQPLGPFLGKSFATSISPWVVPLDALAGARIPGPPQEPAPLPYLRRSQPWGLRIQLEVAINGTVVTSPPFAGMYWTPDQQLAHLTCGGAALRTGDLFASGTVSGATRDTRGSLIEITWNGTEPVTLDDGSSRDFLADGDTVTLTGTAPGPGGAVIGLGEVTGVIVPARPVPPGHGGSGDRAPGAGT